MIDTLGPVIWRASWQATALALLIVLLVRCLGERLSPRWRFLLWSVVLARLLFVATPVSPWSVFNLVHWNPESSARPFSQHEADVKFAPVPHTSDTAKGPYETKIELPQRANAARESTMAQVSVPADLPDHSSGAAVGMTSPFKSLFDAVVIMRILSSIWLAGCVLLGLKLLATALILRRRLSACRPVTDAALLELLKTSCHQSDSRALPLYS